MDSLISFFGSLWVVLGLICFAAIGWWVYRPANRDRMERDSRIIFREDDHG